MLFSHPLFPDHLDTSPRNCSVVGVQPSMILSPSPPTAASQQRSVKRSSKLLFHSPARAGNALSEKIRRHTGSMHMIISTSDKHYIWPSSQFSYPSTAPQRLIHALCLCVSRTVSIEPCVHRTDSLYYRSLRLPQHLNLSLCPISLSQTQRQDVHAHHHLFPIDPALGDGHHRLCHSQPHLQTSQDSSPRRRRRRWLQRPMGLWFRLQLGQQRRR